MKTVLVLSFTNLATDPRVHRQIRFLRSHFNIVAVGSGNPQIEGVSFVLIRPFVKTLFQKVGAGLNLALRSYEGFYWNQPSVMDCLENLARHKVDSILANDIYSLPVALRLAPEGRVIFDAHEFAPAEREDQWLFRVIVKPYREYLCRKYIPQVRGMSTVCDGIARLYFEQTGVRPMVVTNASDYRDLRPTTRSSSDPIQLVHHGLAASDRKTVNMIRVMDYLDDRFELHFFLVEAERGYVDYMKRLAQSKKNIHFHPAAPMLELPETLNRFDLGLYILEPTNINNRLSLPNKFFEFIQARLGIAVAPSPEMAALVQRHRLGIVAPDFRPQSMAEALAKLDHDQIQEFKRNAHASAHELSSAESMKNLRILLDGAMKD